MGISRMKKVFLLGHWKEREILLEELQKAEIFHVRDIAEIDGTARATVSCEADRMVRAELNAARDFMSRFRPPSGLAVFSAVKVLRRQDYENIRKTRPAEELIHEVDAYRTKLDDLDREEKEREDENRHIDLWRCVNINSSDLETSSALMITGEMPVKKIDELKVEQFFVHRVLAYDNRRIALLIVIHRSDVNQVLPWLESLGFHQVNYRDLARGSSAQDRYQLNQARLERIREHKQSLIRELSEKMDLLHDLEVLIQVYEDRDQRTNAIASTLVTERTFMLGGWLRERDMKVFREIVSSCKNVILYDENPSPEEEPPVSLENPRLFSPFEFLTKLYGYPSYKGIDPSAPLSIFFALFFGTALTDAGYGVILSIAALFLMKKSSIPKDFLMILFWGGILSIVMGLVTGGIFGDLLRLEDPYLPAIFGKFRNFFSVMDPLVSPMRFFRFVLLIGVIQIFFGQFIGLWAALRNRRFVDGFVDCLAWILILGSIMTILFSSQLCVSMALVESKTAPFKPALQQPAKYTFAAMAFVVIFFGARNEKSWFFRILIGVLRLLVLSGFFSYIGDILSYIRLMALGMVTGGIGMAVNAVAFMTADIPVIGFFIAAVVFIGGHAFNLAISILGSFVHSLRLQYVEFFSKFYAGGGRAFSPMSHSRRYMKLTE